MSVTVLIGGLALLASPGHAGASVARPPSAAMRRTIPSPPTIAGRNMAIQLNMYGGKGTGTGFNTTVAAQTLTQLQLRTNPMPVTVSLNEVCYTQWWTLWSQYFANNTYLYHTFWSHNRGSQCGDFGNVIMVRGSAGLYFGGSTQPFAQQATDEPPGRKGWACVASNLFGIVGCTSHLTAKTDPAGIRQEQMWEYSVAINPFISNGNPLLAAGDFNLAYADNSTAFLYWWYTLLKESDNVSLPIVSKRVTTDNHGSPNTGSTPKAIDYIWRYNPNSASGDAYILNLTSTDHHWLQMYL